MVSTMYDTASGKVKKTGGSESSQLEKTGMARQLIQYRDG